MARTDRSAPIANSSKSASAAGFSSFGLHDNLVRAIRDAGYVDPRPIQAKTIPEARTGRDVLGLAATGTGKTAAFALPILERLITSRGQNPRTLILAPTRELAIQIHKEIETLGKYTNVRAITVFGGVGAGPQIRNLGKRPDVIVACPGRLLDLMCSGHVKLGGIEVLVLDEADHMLDMGFLPSIKRILAKLPARRQNLLFSATMSKEIRSLADKVLAAPHVVELAHSAPAETIEHELYPIHQDKKPQLLRHLLGQGDFRSAIVFLRTKHRARKLARDLERDGYNAIALQGNMSQPQRTRAMEGFRKGTYDIMVATDIAARGIDVAGVSHVINYDVPDTPDAYTHRIGRTGRSERSGKAYTFVTRDDFDQIKSIEKRLKKQIPRVKLTEFSGGEGGRSAADAGERTGHQRDAARSSDGRANGGRSGGASRGRSGAGGGRGGASQDRRRGAGAGSGGGGRRRQSSSEGQRGPVRSGGPRRGAGARDTGPAFGAGTSDSGGADGGGQRRRVLGGGSGRSRGGGASGGGRGAGGRARGGSGRGRAEGGSSGGPGFGAGVDSGRGGGEPRRRRGR